MKEKLTALLFKEVQEAGLNYVENLFLNTVGANQMSFPRTLVGSFSKESWKY